MWSRKAECALNAHVKEKLCFNLYSCNSRGVNFHGLKEQYHLSQRMDYKHQVFLSVCVYTAQCLKSTSCIQVLRARPIQPSALTSTFPIIT